MTKEELIAWFKENCKIEISHKFYLDYDDYKKLKTRIVFKLEGETICEDECDKFIERRHFIDIDDDFD